MEQAATQQESPRANPHDRGRIVVNEQVYYQQASSQPMVIETRFARWLESDEQPYLRRLSVGFDWQPIDTGWVRNPEALIISNAESLKQLQRNPTDEERRELESRFIEIGILTAPIDSYTPNVVPICVLRPQDSIRLTPLLPDSLQMRGKAQGGKGKVSCTVVAFAGPQQLRG